MSKHQDSTDSSYNPFWMDHFPPVTPAAGKLLMADGIMPLEIRLGGLGWQISAVRLDDWKRDLVSQLRSAADSIEQDEALPPVLAPYVSEP